MRGMHTTGGTGSIRFLAIISLLGGLAAALPAAVTASNDAVLPRDANISSIVWLDANENGQLDKLEPGMPDVHVSLLDCAGRFVAATRSDAFGQYAFAVAAGCYRVRFSALQGYRYCPAVDATGFSRADPATGLTGEIHIARGQTLHDMNAGLMSVDAAQLGDRVWEDLNANGVQDVGEPGLGGVNVNLLDCAGEAVVDERNTPRSARTDASGYFVFEGLTDACYRLQVDAPLTYQFSASGAGVEALDSDVDATTGITAGTKVGIREGRFDVDAGAFRLARIGDWVWFDEDNDGIQDDAEQGVAGIEVLLLTEDGMPTGEVAVTSGKGYYEFRDVHPGRYRLQFVVPAPYAIGLENQGIDVQLDSNANSLGTSRVFEVLSGRTQLDIDLALRETRAVEITLEKLTNGEDADEPTGPYVEAGGDVLWEYIVTNSGTADLFDIALVDDQGVSVTCPATFLDTGASFTCTASTNNAQAGQYVNVAEVCGNDRTDDPIEVCATDTSHYFGSVPGIMIETLTNGIDADVPLGPGIPVGDPVSWEYEVTNTGNVPLTGIVVTDSQGVVVTCPSTTLDPGVTMVCTASGTATAGQYENIGTASGVPPVGVASVEDTDPSHYFGVIGQISLQKLTNGEDADVPPGPTIGVGDAITWQYIVRNEGNVVVGSVTVTDDQGVVVSCPPLNVPPGGTLTCTGTGVATEGPYTNIGTACGQLSDGSDTCASDPSNYTGLGAAVDIETFTQNVDADLPTGPNVIVGLPIAWDYIVTNTGGTTLTDIVVSDDQGVTVTCPATTLAPGASFTCSATGVSTPGQYENIGTVTATGAGQIVTDSDPSHYFGVFFSIDLEKATNGFDADVVPGPAIAVGDPVTWTYVFVNNGNVRLNTISIVDDQGVTINCPAITFLEPNDSVTCTGTGIAQAGQYENTAEVCGFFEEEEVCDSDPSHYFGAGAGLDIEKLTNGEDADTPTGPSITEDDPVNWTYIVTNNGNVTVQNIVVSDDQGVTVTCPQTTLAPTTTMTCTASGIATVGQYVNIGSATGQGVDDNGNPVGDPVGDTDPSHYIGEPIATASIGDFVWVDTDRDGVQDAGEPGVPGVVVTLWTDTDGDGTPDTILTTTTTDANGMYLFADLDPRLVYFVQFGAVPGQPFTTPNVGDDATDSDADPATGISGPITLTPGQTDLTVDAGVIALAGGVSIDKFTNGQDADTPTGPTLPVGSTVNWTYEVTNNGELTLDNIVVTDDQGVTVTCPQTSLAPGASMTCTGSGTASAGQYVNIGSVTGQPTDNGTPVGDPVTGSDPSHYFGAGAGLDIEKLTNGEDADTPTGPSITEDDPVNWTYIVTNNGNVTVQNIVVSDDQGVTVTCPQTTLAPTTTMTCTASGIATVGQYVNIGSATGQGVDDNGNPVGDPVGDTDPSHYIGEPIATASIGDFVWVDTDRDGVQDAGEPGVPGVVVTLWTDTDGDGTPDTILTTTTTDANGMYLFADLDPRLVYFVQFGAVPGQPFTTPNVGDDATDSDADPATGISGPITLTPGQTDLTVDAGVIALSGGVSIDKFTNGQDADTPTGPTLPVGSTVNWTYEVINNGELTLDNIVVTDDQGVTVTCPQTSLAPGASMTCTGSGTASAGQYVNIGSVTGQPTDNGTPVGDPVTGSDPSHYFGAGAGLDIEKLTNGEDADTPTGPTVTEGQPVEWTYVVTNNGNVTVQNIVVSDDQGVTVTCPQTTLAPTTTMTCTGNGIAQLGQYVNIGTATGQPVDDNGNPVGDPVGDTDPSHYLGTPLPVAALGDFLFVDTDRDGVQDAGEPGLPGVVVTLWIDEDGDGLPDTVVASTVTDANGLYLFENLDSRLTYIVQFAPTPGTLFTAMDQGGDDTLDSDVSPATGITGPITLLPGQSDLSIDAGVIELRRDVDIEKSTNGEDADTPTGPSILVGDPVVWTYVVTNSGELPLSDIVVTDSEGVAVMCPSTTLPPSASMTCTGNGIATEGQYSNTGMVSGQPTDGGEPVGPPVSDSDMSHYIGIGDQCEDADIADNFDQVSYGNNDGSMDWYNEWKEFDPQGGGPASGSIRIDNGVLILSDYPNSNKRPSIRRTADLSGDFEAAMLMFDWSTSAEVDKDDEITLKISSDNGVTFSVLDVFRDNDGANSGFASYDITAFMSPRTVIKFVVTNRYGARWDKFMVDNLRILKKCDGGDCVVSSSPEHSIWLPNFNGDGNVDRFDFDPGSSFSQEDDGTARIVGIARNRLDASEAFMVDVNLAGRTTMPPPGSPKNGIGANTADWVYYPLWSGTMTGVEDYDGAQLALARMGPAFQVGTGANDKPTDIDVYGGSGWFTFTRIQQGAACLATGADCISANGSGDFNIRIDCPPNGQACIANETPYHALYLPNFNSDGVLDRYELEDGSQFVASADGSARLLGVVYKNDEPNYRFAIDLTLSGATTSAPPGSPYNPFGADPGDWSYYPVWTGTLSGLLWNTGASVNIERRGASFQVGTGASAHDGEQDEYGASGWFSWITNGQPIDCDVYGDCIAQSGDGDVNIRLDCPL